MKISRLKLRHSLLHLHAPALCLSHWSLRTKVSLDVPPFIRRGLVVLCLPHSRSPSSHREDSFHLRVRYFWLRWRSFLILLIPQNHTQPWDTAAVESSFAVEDVYRPRVHHLDEDGLVRINGILNTESTCRTVLYFSLQFYSLISAQYTLRTILLSEQ